MNNSSNNTSRFSYACQLLRQFCKKFPHGVIGFVLGALVASILARIPVLGWLLAPVILLGGMAGGLGLGASIDTGQKFFPALLIATKELIRLLAGIISGAGHCSVKRQ